MQVIQLLLSRLANEEKGVTTIEYALMLVLVAIAVAAGAPNITNAVTGVFGQVAGILGA